MTMCPPPRASFVKEEGGIPSSQLKVALIREEFVALTKDPLVAIVLNQLMYWTQRVKDFDFFLAEEKEINPTYPVSPRHGWIYKTAEELIEETMLQVSKSTMLRYLNTLLTAGWVDKRSNVVNKWDRTIQYRVNLRKIQEDLKSLGYCLPESCAFSFSLPVNSSMGGSSLRKSTGMSTFQNETLRDQIKETIASSNDASMFQNETSRNQVSEILDSSDDTSIFQNETSKFQNLPSMSQNETSRFQNETSSTEIITKTPTEITNRERASRACAILSEKISSKIISEETPPHGKVPSKMLEVWKKHIGQESLFLSQQRLSQLPIVLSRYFHKDLAEWESFCERIKASRFLMGEGARKWRVSLDWILSEANLCKVLEGNYDEKKGAGSHEEAFVASHPMRAEEISPHRKAQIQAALNKIKDPTWKKWCSQLNFNPRFQSYVIPWQLEAVVKARFFGVEDERLVWIACADNLILSRVEGLRSQLLTVIQRTYPRVRAIRTCLEGEDPLKEIPGESPEVSPTSPSFSDDDPAKAYPLVPLGQLTQALYPKVQERETDKQGLETFPGDRSPEDSFPEGFSHYPPLSSNERNGSHESHHL